MREIKFRQWDVNRKIMYENIGAISQGTWVGFPYVSWDKYPVMQYTGLKDKNDKEIYEGDIVRISLPGFGIEKDITIEWNGNGYGAVMEDYHREVIGNIYENPELLKDIAK